MSQDRAQLILARSTTGLSINTVLGYRSPREFAALTDGRISFPFHLPVVSTNLRHCCTIAINVGSSSSVVCDRIGMVIAVLKKNRNTISRRYRPARARPSQCQRVRSRSDSGIISFIPAAFVVQVIAPPAALLRCGPYPTRDRDSAYS